LENEDLPGTDIITDISSRQNVIHYPPSSYFNIERMWLSVEPDFNTKKIRCEQQLKLTTLQDLEKIELDCAYNDKHKIEIHSIFYSDAASEGGNKKLLFEQDSDKLSIDIGKKLLEGSKFSLIINYSANGTEPPDGFVFIESDNPLAIQAWTQGETTASNKWFPCIDHPQVKFPRQISVIVPENFVVISNGERDIIDQEVRGDKKKRYIWEESHPNTAYVTSIVIGDFAELPKENYDGRVPLMYYVPRGREEDGRRLFKNTLKMMNFFETFFGTKYAYDKYSQVTVERFEYGGMENTTCTTFTTRILPDERTTRDSNTYDYVVVHELAHHWFGDLVTCRDWQHIWLNESFASYSEALYYQHALGQDDYFYYMLGKADDYLNNTSEKVQKIPLVTRHYDTPIDMFETDRTYQKGACILHMLRSLIGDEDFKNSLRVYLDLFKFKTAETDDLRKIFEENSGKSLEEFFDQWIFQAGHPELNSRLSANNSIINIKIQQTQANEFKFPLEILIVLLMDDGTEKKIEDTILIESKETEKSYNAPKMTAIKRFVIDPHFKILKKLQLVIQDTDTSNILINSLINGETVIEKVYAARALKDEQSSDLIEPLKKVVLQDNVYWGVRAEAAKTLGSIRIDTSYEALKECLKAIENNKIKESLVEALGSFSKTDSFDLLKPILENDDESANVQYAAAIAIAKCGNEEETFPILSKLLGKKSYKDIVARGAIEGLKIIALDSQKMEKTDAIETTLIEKSKIGNDARVRQTATSALGYLARYRKERTNIIGHLKSLLNDESIHIRNTAYASLGNAFQYTQDAKIIQDLKLVIKNEDNEFVKQTAQRSMDLINLSHPQSHSLTSEKSLSKDKNYKITTIEDMEKRIVMY
jgi:aminopeptidase N